ncbi:MAG: methyltransferase domain-containing protein [Pseudomonadota bacterium]
MNLNDVSYIPLCRQKWIKLQIWYQTHLGQLIYKSEAKIIEQQLESCFGYSIVQLGKVTAEGMIQSTRIKNKCVMHCFADNGEQNTGLAIRGNTGVVSLLQRLAIKSNSVDVVVLHHCLEFEAFPHEILREVERILVAEGKIIIVFFNPYSLIGLWQFFLRLRFKVRGKDLNFPIKKNWISSNRIEDWLALLGFDSKKVGAVFFRPPISNLTVLERLNFMEKVGKRYWPFFSGSVVYKATKRVSTLTPLRSKWRLKKKVVRRPVAEIKLPRTSKKETHN